MTEYDFSPEAYDRFIQSQSRVAKWVEQTEQHRQGFEAAVPGAPGLLPAPRRQSPPVPDPRLPSYRPAPSYPIYRRAPPSSSSSENSYVHPPAKHSHRPRLPHPPIYAPPIPTPFPVPPHPSPVVVRVDGGDRVSHHSPRCRHHRSKSHSHSHRSPPPPPRLVTPIYTSPAAPSFIPPPPIIYMSSQGFPVPSTARPVISPRERYRKPLSQRTRRLDRPPTPPATPLTSSSSSTDDAPYRTSSPISPTSLPFPPSPAPTPYLGPSNSGPGGSRPKIPSVPWQEDQTQKHSQYYSRHHRHINPNIHPGLEPPYINRDSQEQSANTLQRSDYHHRAHDHSRHDPSKRSSNSSSQSHNHPHSMSRPSPITLLPQSYVRYTDPSYGKSGSNLSTATPNTRNGVISVSVPSRYPIDDREFEPPSNLGSSSHPHAHSKQLKPPILHAPQPMRHPHMLINRLRTSTRA